MAPVSPPGRRIWLTAALGIAVTLPAAAHGAEGPRASEPPPGTTPILSGDFRVNVRITAGGSAFGQHRGETAKRSYRLKERCRGAEPCDRVRLVRAARSGKFGSVLKRRGASTWHGIEKVQGRCDSGLAFHATTRIEIRATAYRGEAVSGFTGRLDSRVRGCVDGQEHAVLRGRLR